MDFGEETPSMRSVFIKREAHALLPLTSFPGGSESQRFAQNSVYQSRVFTADITRFHIKIGSTWFTPLPRDNERWNNFPGSCDRSSANGYEQSGGGGGGGGGATRTSFWRLSPALKSRGYFLIHNQQEFLSHIKDKVEQKTPTRQVCAMFICYDYLSSGDTDLRLCSFQLRREI
ncbi:hypothetical protein EYF80_040895 [Liparis tanakae]|uniref:Uncharacterized protein n=1 Tax=Liparis tanakae TaxID=230148 RepID=A0A4Z2G7L0_9TELE|nr:hypothetical protein EYF80_040895 [Liparis tanakae]